MDIVTFIKSINAVAIIIFFLTGFSLVYELYLFFKQSKSKKAPKIPTLESVSSPRFQKKFNFTRVREKKSLFKKPNYSAISILIIIFLIFGTVAIIGRLSGNGNKQSSNTANSSTVSPSGPIISSEGIVFYLPSWKQLTKNQLRFVKTGDKIIIGLKNIPQSDIGKARIRINSAVWNSAHETTEFNAQFDIFYKEYTIATADAKLTIEAQLYSKIEGWLGK